jgi:transcriptional regulator with PAS, ATPase and Fis domain
MLMREHSLALTQANDRFSTSLNGREAATSGRGSANPPSDQLPPPMTLEEIERRHILAALQRHGGNRAAAAAELNISVRKLYYRLQQYVRELPREELLRIGALK